MSTGQAAAPVAYETILYAKKGHVAYVTLNRPKVLNALNHTALGELNKAFEDASLDHEVRGVILTGAGEKAFIAGADITEGVHARRTSGPERHRESG
jgi:enoyl-CoA hydratase